MKKFILSSIGFSLLVVVLYTIISSLAKPKIAANSDFMAAIIDKHDRIEQLHGPKMIFAGGSNLSFGLNSEEIEKSFSVPVVNLGLHAGLGLNFMVNELKSTIKNGDIVFLSIEYLLGPDGDYLLKKNTSNSYKKAGNFYKFDLKSELLANINITRTNLKAIIRNDTKPNSLQNNIHVYSRKAFNKYGDVIVHLGKKSSISPTQKFVLTYQYWNGINELNEFAEFAKSKNVQVYFLYPCLAESEFKLNQEVIGKTALDISRNLKIEILNSPTDLVFPDSMFYDTYYHLNKEGREIRTQKVIKVIENNYNSKHRLIEIMSSI